MKYIIPTIIMLITACSSEVQMTNNRQIDKARAQPTEETEVGNSSNVISDTSQDSAIAESVEVSWSANTEENLFSYQLFASPKGEELELIHNQKIDEEGFNANEPSIKLSLAEHEYIKAAKGKNVCFAVAAVNVFGESEKTDTVCVDIP